MTKTCNNCKTKNDTVVENQNMPPVPFAAHESAMARSERQSKRLWIIILVLIGALIGTNLAWIIYESQFETLEYSYDYQQDGNGNNIIGNGNEVDYNGAETSTED